MFSKHPACVESITRACVLVPAAQLRARFKGTAVPLPLRALQGAHPRQQQTGMEEDMARQGSVTVLIPFSGVPTWLLEVLRLQCCVAMGNTLVQGGVSLDLHVN